MANKRKVKFTVTMEFTEVPPKSKIREYVKESLEFWGAEQRCPEDEFFSSKISKVTVGKIEGKSQMKISDTFQERYWRELYDD